MLRITPGGAKSTDILLACCFTSLQSKWEGPRKTVDAHQGQ